MRFQQVVVVDHDVCTIIRFRHGSIFVLRPDLTSASPQEFIIASLTDGLTRDTPLPYHYYCFVYLPRHLHAVAVWCCVATTMDKIRSLVATKSVLHFFVPRNIVKCQPFRGHFLDSLMLCAIFALGLIFVHDGRMNGRTDRNSFEMTG